MSDNEIKDADHQLAPANPNPSSRPRKYLILGAALLVGLLFLVGVMPRVVQSRKNDNQATTVNTPEVRINVAKSERKPINLVLPSSTQAHHITPIWARTNGYLVKLKADIGDVVKEGQILAVLDTPEVDQQYNQAVADLAVSKANREIAKISNERWQELYKKNSEALSKQEVDERQATFTSSEAQVTSSEANVSRLKQLQDYKYITAPFDGIITTRNIDLGSLITAGSSGSPQQLFTIAQTDTIRNYVFVPQNYFRSVHVGLEGQVKIREFPEKLFKGVVSRFASALDPVSRTLLTEVDIDNKDGEVLAGLYAEVTFTLTPDTPYFIIPTTAIIIRAGDPRVAIVDENDTVHLKVVKIGKDYGKTLEITDGLNDGDRVIINPSDRIIEGGKVKVSEPEKPEKPEEKKK